MVKAARLIMVSNYLISVLFAVFLAAHIASHRGRFLNRAIVRHAPSDSCATLPLFKEFLCHHFSLVVLFFLRVTVQFEAACSPRTPLCCVPFD